MTSMAFVLAAGPAVALSCLRPDVAESFSEAEKAADTYHIVRGVFDFDEELLPPRDDLGIELQVSAKLKGKALSDGGFSKPFDQDVLLDLKCSNPLGYCGYVYPGLEYLAFLRVEESG
ncbi:MAG: hypothetical protein ACE369_16655, partial [Roseovarius sp.]